MSKGARRNLYRPNGIINVIKTRLCLSSGHWWYPFKASITVKYLVYWSICRLMSAIALIGVGEVYNSRFTYLLNREKSTYIRISSEFFFCWYDNGCALFCRMRNWLNYSLRLERIQLFFDFIFICVRNRSWRDNTKRFGIVSKIYFKQFAIHDAYLFVKRYRKFIY